ncbi:MAG: hypothetical protein PWQ63_942 [Methanolobus sp.]|jgi:hypothetical protein|nr:hypothetical protein [Methanolobus sp.]
MKKNAESDKSFIMNAHVRERSEEFFLFISSGEKKA